MKYIIKAKSDPMFVTVPTRAMRVSWLASSPDDLSYEEMSELNHVTVGIVGSIKMNNGIFVSDPVFHDVIAAAWFNSTRVYMKLEYQAALNSYHVLTVKDKNDNLNTSVKSYPTLEQAYNEFAYQTGIKPLTEDCLVMGYDEHAGDWNLATCDGIHGNLPYSKSRANNQFTEPTKQAIPVVTPKRPACFGSFS